MLITHDRLEDFATRLLIAAGVGTEESALVARTLVAANLRGIDSHGVQLLQYYLGQLEAGDVDPRAHGHIEREDGACIRYHGDNGLGQVIAGECTRHAARLAKNCGLGLVTARESNHFGAAYWWARSMAREGLIGIVMCNASQLVPPWQGKQPRFGTNPICMALPGEESWLLDMATTTVAAGKIFKAHINQQPEIPMGWAMDRDGVPTTKTEEAYQGLLMPLGGYKGYGLAIMAEILSGVLSGGGYAMDIGGIRVRGRATRISQVYLAIDIARFMPIEEFQERMDRLVEMLKSSAPAKGHDEVLIAGEPERRKEAQRRAEGIPVESGNWAGLCEFAAKLGVAVPE